MSVTQRTTINMLSRILASVIRFAVISYVVIFLGPGVLGAFALYRTVVVFGTLPLDLGFQDSMIKRISESDGTEADRFFTIGMLATTGLSLASVPIFVLLGDTIAEFVGANVLSLIVLGTIAQTFTGVTNSVLKGENKIRAVSYIDLSRKALTSILQLALAIWGMGLTGLILGELVGFGLSIVLGLLYSSVGLRLPTKRNLISILTFSKYSWITPIDRRVRSRLDTFMLGAFFGPVIVGVYELVWSITNVFYFVTQSMEVVFFPEISSRETSGGEKSESIVGTGIGYGVVSILPGIAGALVLGEELLGFFGAEYRMGYLALVVLLIARLSMVGFDLLSSYFKGLDRPRTMFWGTLIFVVTNLILNLALTPVLKMVGTALATGLSFAIATGYYLTQTREPLEIPTMLVAKGFVSALVMSVIVKILSFPLDGNVFLISSVTIGGLLYVTALYLTDSEIRERTRTVVRGI